MSIKYQTFSFFNLLLYYLIFLTILISSKKSKDSNLPGEEYGEDEESTELLGYISLKFNQSSNYLVSSVKIGTPPQEIDLILDIGSERTWVSNKFFDKSKSSSYFTKDVFETHKEYDFKYNGIACMDTFEIENKTLEDFQFILVDELINYINLFPH